MELKMRIERREAKKAKNGYTYRVKINYIDEYGIKQTYSKGGFETKKEAHAHGVEIEHELQTKGTLTKKCKKTLNDCILEAMELEKKRLARNSIIRYQNIYKVHIQNARISQVPITQINYTMLQTHFNGLSEKGECIVKVEKAIFNKAFKHALKCKYIQENPMHDIELVYKKSNKETHIITSDELDQIIECFLSCRGDFNKYAYCIVVYCGYYLGLRITEILALEKSDFDLDNGLVHISKRLEDRGLKKSKMYLTETLKTQASKTTLPVPEPLKEILLQWFAFNPYDLVCCNKNGDFLPINSFRILCRKIGKKLDFDFHPHCLRHTYITNIVRSGCDIKTASKLARHSDVKTTLNIYTQSSEESKIEAINNVFGNKSPKNAPNPNILN
ncbi:site-specific integrase [Dubosiella newyorkensis]|uniref:site-specific integrase n=1 Tax=Dubosiella newyorkensis TaxID=1862672 RepID=UPI00272F70FE|nr:site-specific integrase [Dubosiella newyorkensis]